MPTTTELVDRISQLATGNGLHRTAISPLWFVRADSPSAILPVVYEPRLNVVVQGKKRVLLADEVFHYDALHYLVVTVTVPVSAEVVQASADQPYLALRLDINPQEIAPLLLELGSSAPSRRPVERGMYVARMSGALLDAVLRLVRMLDTPQDIQVLAPLVLREIYYRLLVGEFGHRMRDLLNHNGQARRITQAVEWIKTRYAEPLCIEVLADTVSMSPSSFHHRFKDVVGMSPLQFQKQLRLHEARRLMLSRDVDAATAGHQVGYESPSQFSREYHRLFGAPPRREIAQLRGR